jgi:hypothetical protein
LKEKRKAGLLARSEAVVSAAEREAVRTAPEPMEA